MTRVFGRLFEDGRDGVLVVKPSQPFFGVDKYERHYAVTDGCIDIDLLPTPKGIHYFVGFKAEGDYRDTAFTLRWRIPTATEVDISAKPKPAVPQRSEVKDRISEVQVRRLASELADALNKEEQLVRELDAVRQAEKKQKERVKQLEAAMESALTDRDNELATLRVAGAQPPQIIYRDVPVAPEPLKERIATLEAENQRLREINESYYESVLELHQLKLNRAQTVNLPNAVTEIPDTPRQRLIHKLLAK